MKSLKAYQRLLLFLFLLLVLTSILSPLMALGAEWFRHNLAEISSEPYRFSRIFNRTFMISGILLFFACRGVLHIGKLSSLGIVSLDQGAWDLTMGWLLAIGSMAALIWAMSVSDVFEPYFRLSLAVSIERCASAFLTGIVVGFLEEIFFRGIFFKGLFEEGRRARAFILANLFYSALHFVRPGEPTYITRFDPWAGFRHLLTIFQPFLDLWSFLPGFFGLFLIGWVLSYAFVRTGNLYLSVGLHAGWIFSLKTIRVFGDYSREDLGWMFGATDPKIVSGVVSWLDLIMVGLAVHWLTRPRAGLISTPPPPKVE
jgi:membrane protease YdiL (CAAX protease family)